MNARGTATVRVLLFGALAERFGRRELSAAASATVADLWSALAADEDAAARDGVRPARNRSFCAWDEPMRNGDEIAFMPPVSGG